MPPIPPITKWLMIICTAVFCVLLLIPGLGHWLALQPLQSGNFMPWQPVTFAFMHHNSPFELFFNLLALWMFGADLERLWGWKRYVQFLVASVLTAAALALLMMVLTGAPFGTQSGASAAIYGLLFAMGMMFPDRTIMPLFPPIPMKMRTFVLVFGVVIFVVTLAATRSLVEVAMLAGMLGAWLHIRWWRQRGKRIRRVH